MKSGRRLWPFYTVDALHSIERLVTEGETYSSDSHPMIVELERQFALRHHGDDRRSLFVGSGTAALFAAYFAMDLPVASEVLVPAQTFHATVAPLLWLGLRPTFCRCDRNTGLIDLDDAFDRIGPRTAALVITHLWGQLVDVGHARAVCDTHDLALIEDCSHAHGAVSGGVVQLADASAYSLGTKKIVSGGSGGMVILPQGEPFERGVVLTQPAPRALEIVPEGSPLRGYATTGLGMNLRGSPLSAVLALDHLRRLDSICQQKNETMSEIATLVRRHLPGVTVAAVPMSVERTLYALPMWLDEPSLRQRDRMVRLLNEVGFRAVVSARSLVHRELFRRPGIVPASSVQEALQGIDEADDAESGTFRFDTRDMYEPWTSTELADASDALARVGRAVAA